MVPHSFKPFSVVECDNTSCVECAFSANEYPRSRQDCPQRKRMMGQGYQSGLAAWGAC
jgi:hypothetical protein